MDNLVREINEADPIVTTDPKDRYCKKTERKGAVDVDAGQAGISAQSINEIFNSPTIGALAMNEDVHSIDSMSSMEDIIGKERVAEFVNDRTHSS